MRSLLSCFVFILFHSVVAQAAPFADADFQPFRTEPERWVSTHAGETLVDGMEVIASFEIQEEGLKLPLAEAEAMVPLAPLQEQAFRLVLIVKADPSLRAEIPLIGTTLRVDGETRFAYLSADQSGEFRFMILTEKNDSFRASFERSQESGEFTLEPLPRVMQ